MKKHLVSFILIVFFSAAAAADSATDLTGRVVDEKGQPIAGAKVAAIGYPSGSQKIREPVSTATGADGSFRLERKNLPRVAAIVASKDGKSIDWADWLGADSAQMILQLGQPAAIEGEIVDEAGNPLVGASVGLLLSMGEPPTKKMYLTLGVEPFLARTDAQGRFRFSSLPEQATAAFDVTATGRARALAEGHFAPGQKGIRIVLPPEGRIEGIVVEKRTGRPLAGMTVHAIGSLTSGIYQAFAKTDGSGRFGMGGVSAGKYSIKIVGEGNAMPEWDGSQEKLQVENGKTALAKIEAARCGILEIVAVDAATGKPVVAAASFQVSLAEDVRIGKSAMMAGDGVARVSLPPGKYAIPSMFAIGYSYEQEKGRLFSVEVGKTEHAEVSVAAVPQIALIAMDWAAKPVPAAIGQVLHLQGPPKSIIADANGRLVLDSADIGPLFCFVLVRHPQQNLAALVVVGKDGKPPDVRLCPPARLSGTVKDAEGRPVANATVQVQIDASHMGRFAIIAGARTDSGGRYNLDLPCSYAGQYAVSARAPGFSVAEVMVDQPEIVPAREIVKDLMLKASNRKVRGVVRDTEGKPVVGAVITSKAMGSQNYPGSSITDASGRFVLEGLDAAPVIYIFARVPGRGWIGDSAIKPDDQELIVTVAPSHWD